MCKNGFPATLHAQVTVRHNPAVEFLYGDTKEPFIYLTIQIIRDLTKISYVRRLLGHLRTSLMIMYYLYKTHKLFVILTP